MQSFIKSNIKGLIKYLTDSEHKRIEWTVTTMTVVLLVLTVLTYILDQHKENWVCGPVLLLFELIALGLQAILNYIIWLTECKKLKLILLAVSGGVLAFIVWGFINFELHCS